jgi:hypothetical protein
MAIAKSVYLPSPLTPLPEGEGLGVREGSLSLWERDGRGALWALPG